MASNMPLPTPPPISEQLQHPPMTLSRSAESPKDEEMKKTEHTEEGPAGAEQTVLPTHHAENGLVDQTNYLPTRSILVALAAMQMTVFLAFLDQTVVSTALPNISAAFNAGSSSSWVASAYLLTSTAFQPVWGRVSDIFGRKYCLLACISIFFIGSLACALAQTMTQLIIFRGLKGVGGGGLLTLVLIVISDVVSLRERGRFQGITEVTIAIANGCGPVIGGALSEQVSWRWCFWLNLPIAALALACCVLFLPLKKVPSHMKTQLGQIDYGGVLLSLAATVLLLLPLNWGGTAFPWSSSTVIGCLVGAVVGFFLFFLWEGRIARIPIIPAYIFCVQTVAAIFFNTFTSGSTILVQLFYLPQLLQIAFGLSAIRSGVLVIPLLVMTTFMVFLCGQLLARTGEYKAMIVIGYALWCIGLGLISTLDETSSTARLVGYLILTGSGQGQTLQTSMVAAQAAVDRKDMAVVTSTRNFLRSLGGTISLAVAAAVINNTLSSRLRPLGFSSETVTTIINDPLVLWRDQATLQALLGTASKSDVIDAYVRGFRTVFLIFVGLQGLNCIVAFALIRRISLTRDDEDALKARGKEHIEARKNKRRANKQQKQGHAEEAV